MDSGDSLKDIIKQLVLAKGADVCGIAHINRFTKVPRGSCQVICLKIVGPLLLLALPCRCYTKWDS